MKTTRPKRWDPEDKKKLISAAWRVWEVVASDALQVAQECGETLTNAGVREMVLDADYMLMYAKFDWHSLGYNYQQCLTALKGEHFV